MTQPLAPFDLPLPDIPPSDFAWSDRALSTLSTTTGFQRGLENRDAVQGELPCVICGDAPFDSQACHIIPRSNKRMWSTLKEKSWIPRQAKDSPEHEPRNGLTMCPSHHNFFDKHRFFIRYIKSSRQFVLINFSGMASLQPYHRKAINLDITHCHAPFPVLFVIHEVLVRANNPFCSTSPELPLPALVQDWLQSQGVSAAGSSHQSGPGSHNMSGNQSSADNTLQASQIIVPHDSYSMLPLSPLQHPTSSSGGSLALDAATLQDILDDTRSSLSWKTCQLEGTSWTGTAEENVVKYRQIMMD